MLKERPKPCRLGVQIKHETGTKKQRIPTGFIKNQLVDLIDMRHALVQLADKFN